MVLKAVIFDFNGIIIDDEAIHLELIAELLLSENLRPDKEEIQEVCLGRSDRAGLQALWERQGRVLTPQALQELMERKSQAYRQRIQGLETLPIYPGLVDFILKLRLDHLKLALVSGALRQEVETVLDQIELLSQFPVRVTGDDTVTSKPDPEGYLLAVQQLNGFYPELELQPQDCLAIEDSPAGIEAARRAGMQVLGVANTYPVHMLQRQVDWVVDELGELELDRVQAAFDPSPTAPPSGS
ncbi:HAD family phosphatase [Phormidium yuhuli AB48]|uniref:HAD family phosphatase n=1 Tax=Phormidium yuhuli AB48 TaxID=2940671 RepID=A0ABY5AMY2_9CYAN|nr:HAD family phosphatase [Phormidium yuhuli]USR90542.1 HAD family phosphatase [Phormidium yuhuli AB48]